jgi:trypsin
MIFLVIGSSAHAVVGGRASAQARYAVRLGGNGAHCSGVVIAQNLVATAGHCAGLVVVEGGRSFRTAGVSQSAILEDGRRVNVSGDAVILRLAAPLPAEKEIAPIGDGDGDAYLIAGFGTTDERWSGPSAVLHEATLVAHSPRELVDPKRSGAMSASACFGDSGGPVVRGGMLVGIITRATYPSSRRACGYLTRWEPLTVSSATVASAMVASAGPIGLEAAAQSQAHTAEEPKSTPVKRVRVRASGPFNLFVGVRAQKMTVLPRSIRSELASY